MTTRTHPNPAGGRWAWRDYLPSSMDEWLELRNRALELRPPGVDVLGFIDWTLAEMHGGEPHVSDPTGAKYRRVLYELAQSAPPPKKRRRRSDSGVTDLTMAASVAAGGSAGALVAQMTGKPALGALVAVLDVTGTAGDDAGDELEALQRRGSAVVELHTSRAGRRRPRGLELHTLAEAS